MIPIKDKYTEYIIWIFSFINIQGWCPRHLMIKVIYSGIVLSEFELQSTFTLISEEIRLGKIWTPLSAWWVEWSPVVRENRVQS